MKTIGVSGIPKFRLLVFLGHPSSDANKEGWGVLHALVCVELLSWVTQDSGLVKSAFYCPVDVTQFQFLGCSLFNEWIACKIQKGL